jgi:hypothetical protein
MDYARTGSSMRSRRHMNSNHSSYLVLSAQIREYLMNAKQAYVPVYHSIVCCERRMGSTGAAKAESRSPKTTVYLKILSLCDINKFAF